MSEEVYSRAIVREQTIWTPFLYGVPETEIEDVKTIIFGLYANTYLLGHNYLEDIEAEELQRLVDAYDSNMAELSAEEQLLVLRIASDKYVKAIEIQIKNNVLNTKARQLDANEQEYEAKLAALVVDQEALATKQKQVVLAIDRAELKNKMLVSKIQLESLAQKYVEVEIAEKELAAEQAELRVLYVELRGLEIQMSIANVALQIAEAEASKSQITVDIANYKVRAAMIDLVNDRLTIAIAQAAIAAAEEAVNTARESLVNSKGDLVTIDTENIEGLVLLEAFLEEAQKGVTSARTDNTIQGYTDRESVSAGRVINTNTKEATNIEIGAAHLVSQLLIANGNAAVPLARIFATRKVKIAAVRAAEILATAEITTHLTHQIGSA